MASAMADWLAVMLATDLMVCVVFMNIWYGRPRSKSNANSTKSFSCQRRSGPVTEFQ